MESLQCLGTGIWEGNTMTAEPTNADHNGLARFRISGTAWHLREAIAITVWVFVLIKLVVFDIDIYLVERFVPAYRWVIDIKLAILMVSISAIWFILGQDKFVSFVGYIVLYPFVLIILKLPKYLFRIWPVALVFSPIIYFTLRRLRSTFLLYTVAIVSVMAVVTQTDVRLLVGAMIGLGLFLAVHLFRSLRGAYSSNLFANLVQLTHEVREEVKAGGFETQIGIQQTASASTQASNPKSPNVLPQMYLTYSIAEFVSGKVRSVARGRKYELYLVMCLAYTVIATSLVYALEYSTLNRFDATAFRGSEGAGFDDFYRFSLGVLTTSNVSSILPSSNVAGILASTELACSFLILIIFVFLILTDARESFRGDMEKFAAEVQGIAAALEARLTAVYALNIRQLERILLKQESNLVNPLRKLRGLTEINLPISEEATAQRNVARVPQPPRKPRRHPRPSRR